MITFNKFMYEGDSPSEYQAKYRKTTNRTPYITGNSQIRRSLKAAIPSEKLQESFLKLVGLTTEQMHNYLNLTEKQWDEFLSGKMEIDHLISWSYLQKKQPDCLPFFHKWYNLRLVSKAVNRKKQKKIEDNLCSFLAALYLKQDKVQAVQDHLEDELMLARVTARLAEIDGS